MGWHDCLNRMIQPNTLTQKSVYVCACDTDAEIGVHVCMWHWRRNRYTCVHVTLKQKLVYMCARVRACTTPQDKVTRKQIQRTWCSCQNITIFSSSAETLHDNAWQEKKHEHEQGKRIVSCKMHAQYCRKTRQPVPPNTAMEERRSLTPPEDEVLVPAIIDAWHAFSSIKKGRMVQHPACKWLFTDNTIKNWALYCTSWTVGFGSTGYHSSAAVTIKKFILAWERELWRNAHNATCFEMASEAWLAVKN